MITAVDTSVLIDVFASDQTFRDSSEGALRLAIDEGELIACEVVWAEVVAAFGTPSRAHEGMAELGVRFSGVDLVAASAAGAAWKSYRREGGARSRLIGDFLVGAHAKHQADRLLTRDRGFYRAYFRDLAIIDPTPR